jgi:hypothetical protein
MDDDNGLNKFANFVKTFPVEKSKYDYFNLLEHISSCKLDRQTVNEIFMNSNHYLNRKQEY